MPPLDRLVDDARRLVGSMVREMPWSTAIFDREMRYLAYNQDWVATHGYADKGDLIGRRHYDVFPEITEAWRQIHARCLAGATERSELDVFVRADGAREYLRWVVAPLRDADDQIAGIIIFAENLTEQVETRRRLQERDALIGGLFEQSPIGLNLCRMDGLWLESNPSFLEIIGYTRAEADGGLTYWQLTPRSYDADEAVQLEHLRSTGRYGPYTKEFIRKDGRRVPVRLNGFLVERDGERYIWSLIEDLTAQRALEATVEQARIKAIQTAKLATLGEMAAGIAHEINNPLNIIDSFAFMLRDALKRGDVGEANDAIDVIRDACHRAATIVSGLKRFARQAEDAAEPVFLGKLVEETLALWSTRVHAEPIELDVTTDPRARVQGRAIELGQVLVNLLNNARDAATRATTRWIRIEIGVDGDDAVISVEDSGPGIARELADDVFRAFFTTKPAGEGTGLGLSISREIIERHRGTLSLDREAPHTRFVIRLPRIVE